MDSRIISAHEAITLLEKVIAGSERERPKVFIGQHQETFSVRGKLGLWLGRHAKAFLS